jgi:hypothetical protein
MFGEIEQMCARVNIGGNTLADKEVHALADRGAGMLIYPKCPLFYALLEGVLRAWRGVRGSQAFCSDVSDRLESR